MLTISWVPCEVTAEEHRTFDGAHTGMQQGWTAARLPWPRQRLAPGLEASRAREGAATFPHHLGSAMRSVTPYLNFDGTAEQAFAL